MVSDIYKQANFLDLIIVITVFRICYVALKTGLVVEIFKLLGVLFATYISLHYYISISDIIQNRFLPPGMPLEFFDFLIFIFLFGAGYMLFVALRVTLYRFIKLEALPAINKTGGLLLGLLRGFFVTGVLVFMLSISTTSYLSRSVKHSYLGNRAIFILPNTYSWLWDNIFSKFSAKDNFNPTVNEALKKFNADETK